MERAASLQIVFFLRLYPMPDWYIGKIVWHSCHKLVKSKRLSQLYSCPWGHIIHIWMPDRVMCPLPYSISFLFLYQVLTSTALPHTYPAHWSSSPDLLPEELNLQNLILWSVLRRLWESRCQDWILELIILQLSVTEVEYIWLLA
jgi:hypothetical protein